MAFLDNIPPDLAKKKQSTGQLLGNIYKAPVSTAQAISAGAEEAFYGVGTLNQGLDYLAIQSADTENKTPLTEESYKSSEFFRDDITYYKGMTQEGLSLINDRKQNQEYRDFISSKAPFSFGATALVSSFAEPANLGISVATVGAGGLLAKVPKFAKIASGLSKTGRFVAGTVAESAVSTAITGYASNKLSEKTQDEQLTLTDHALNFAGDVGLSIGIDRLGKAVSKGVANYRLNQMEKSIVTQAETGGLTPDYILSTVGVESNFNPKAVNRDTGAFGYFQFLPSTAKEYGITPNSTIAEQTDAFIKFTNENKAYLEKELGRDIDNVDLYMAHWLGRGGASKILQYKNDVKFLDVAGDIYDNPRAVLTQNGLPEDATIGDMKRSRANKMAKGLRSVDRRKTFTTDMDLLVKTDHAMAKSLNDEVVTFNEINAKEMQKISDDADNFLKQFNDDFDKQITDIENRISQDNTDLELLRAENVATITNFKEQFDVKYSELLNKNQTLFKDIFDFKIDPVDFYAEVDHKTYTGTFNELNIKKQQYNEIATQIQNFDLEARKTEIAKQSQVPLDTINAIDNEINTLKEQRVLERENLKGKKLRLFDSQTENLLNDLKSKKTDITLSQFATNADNQSIDYIQALKQANRTARQELQSLKQQLTATKADIQSTSAALSQMNQDFKQSINKFMNDSFLQSLNPKREYIDYEGASEIDATTDYINSIKPSEAMQSLENDIDRLKQEGVLDDEMQELVNRLYEIDDNTFNSMYSSVKGCLLGGNAD